MTKPVKVTIKDWGKGLNKDQPAWELAPGYWSDCQNMRFRNGKAERMGGIATVNTPSQIPYGMAAYSSGASRYLVYAGLTKAYSYDGTTETEITRRTAAQTVTALSRSGTTVTVTTGANHGLSVGNGITVFGVPNIGGGSTGINGSWSVATVPNSTSFTYTTVKNGSFTATSAQLASIGYTLNSAAILNFTAGIDDKITLGNSNGVLIYNNPVDGLLYWDQASAGRLVAMQGYSGNLADAARPFKNYIVLVAPTVSGTKYRHAILWSSAADPGTVPLYFTASATNDSGQQDCVSEREAIDGMEWGDTFQLYKGDCRFSISYIGGNAVFDFRHASVYSKDDGLLAANCIANTPKGQVFVSGSLDIRIHSGAESNSLVEGRMLASFRSRVDSTNRKRTFVEVNPYTNEVWVCFPESGQSTCTKALVWNWNDDTWGERDLANVTCACSGFIPTGIATGARMLVGTSSPKTGLVDSGTTDFGNTYTSMLERTGMDLDSTDFKTLHQSMPRFDASTNFTASIFHGSAPTQDGAVTYASAQTYTHNTTQRVSAFAPSGRYPAWKMTTTASDTPALRTMDLWFNQDGEW
jgi:hypothetical protein